VSGAFMCCTKKTDDEEFGQEVELQKKSGKL
jgi:hypothetical protein